MHHVHAGRRSLPTISARDAMAHPSVDTATIHDDPASGNLVSGDPGASDLASGEPGAGELASGEPGAGELAIWHGEEEAATHVPVLFDEVMRALDPRAGGRYVDGTAGRGGHAEGILRRGSPDGRVLALDADPAAVAAVRERLAPYGERAVVVQANFGDLASVARAQGWAEADGVLLDLGLSSPQLATAGRGFSFAADGPLDMRFDPTRGATAADLVNTLDEGALARIFRECGEEPRSRAMARAVVEARRRGRLQSTVELARLAERVIGRHGRIHPATRIFQALRIAVNGELDTLAAALPQAVSLLRPGGRVAIIAFHSLEDRLVKRFLQQEMRTCVCPSTQPVCTCAHRPTLRAVSKGAIKAGDDEVRRNPRARSARLRVAERL